MSAKHTPAPWRLSGVDVVNGDDHWCINGHALVNGFHSATDCRLATVYSIEANARLIAASPELLASLINLTDRIDYYASLKADDTPNIEDWAYTLASGDMADARAAIAKATGAAQ